MCEDCGCGDIADHGHHHHSHDGHTHDHKHDHDHDHVHESKTVQVEKKVLMHNDEIAEQNRQWLAERGVVAVNIISSPGSGKTMLLEKTLERLNGTIKCAVITGDQQTDNDAKRLQGKGAEVTQIETINSCHLDAERIQQILPDTVKDGTQLLFIENIGNLVCPSSFDLGENFKIALLSVTEGEDKPVKYPTLFSRAAIAVLTKMDLVPYLDWDLKACRDYLRKIQPGIFVFELSAKTGDGMDAWIDYLSKLVE
ncbi:hydrogenase accessory protein HypB [bacterium B17]|nr:hydrogenase accessory protein HypB [bacterium B17]